MTDDALARLGRAVTTSILRSLDGATLGQCEAVDLVPTADDAEHRRCPSTGVRIREIDDLGRARHRTVCPAHGYEPPFTPPLLAAEL